MTGDDLADAALRLIGTPFRLHGRDPATGLDCIGLLGSAMAMAGHSMSLPNGYSLRQRSLPELADWASHGGFLPVRNEPQRPGDVIVTQPSICQIHLAIVTDGPCVVHAHAGLQKVVKSAAPLPWPIISHWRLVTTPEIRG